MMTKLIVIAMVLSMSVSQGKLVYADPETPSPRPTENRPVTSKDKIINDTKRDLSKLLSDVKRDISAKKAKLAAGAKKSQDAEWIRRNAKKEIARLKRAKAAATAQ